MSYTVILPAIFLLVLLVVPAVSAELIAPYDPVIGSLESRLAPPVWLDGGSEKHILGADHLGRDIMSRVIHGGRIQLLLVVGTLGSGGILGIIVGYAAGSQGGWQDAAIMRAVCAARWVFVGLGLLGLWFNLVLGLIFTLVALLAIAPRGNFRQRFQRFRNLRSFVEDPAIRRLTDTVQFCGVFLPSLLLTAMLGPNAASLAGVMALALVPSYAQATREWVRRERELSQSSRARLFRRLAALAALHTGIVIGLTTWISYLGIGVPHPSPSWGLIMSDGRSLLVTGWWIAAFPALAIAATMASAIWLHKWLARQANHADARA